MNRNVIFIVAVCIAAFILGGQFNQPAVSQTETEEGFPYQIIKIKVKKYPLPGQGQIGDIKIGGRVYNDGDELYVGYNRELNTVAPITMSDTISSSSISYTFDISENNPTTSLPAEKPTPYQIVANPKGGCYIMDPDTGKTWAVNSKGDTVVVLDN